MGDRISIQFKNGDSKSVVLFSHWDGRSLLDRAQNYLDNRFIGMDNIQPLGRKDPETVMVDFIVWLLKDKGIISSNYYLGATSNDGDNSDNGHFMIDLKAMKIEGYESICDNCKEEVDPSDNYCRSCGNEL